jgi:TP901 family phage tail tape measure protein
MAGALDIILNFRANNNNAVSSIQDLINNQKALKTANDALIRQEQLKNATAQNDINILRNQRAAIQGTTSASDAARQAIDNQILSLRNQININNQSINTYRARDQAIQADINSLNAQRQAMEESEDQAQQLEQQNRQLGLSFGALTTAAAAMATMFAKTAVSAAKEFGGAMDQVASITLDSKGAMDEMTEGIIQFINSRLDTSATEVANTLYELRSAGISSADSMQALNDVLLASKGTQSGASETARVLAGVVNAYGKEVISTTDAANIFTRVVQDGVTTGSELASSLGQITGIASGAGVSFEEVGAAISVLTQSGIGTSEAITSLKATISTVLKPSEEAKKLFKDLNIEFDANALKSKGLVGLMKELSDKTGGNAEVMAKLIPSVEALNGVLSLSKNGADKFSQSLQRMQDSAGAAKDSSDKVAEGFSDSIDRMNNAINLLVTLIGENIGQTLQPFIEAITKIIQGFNELTPETRKIVLDFVKWSGIITIVTSAIISLNFALAGFVGLNLIQLITSLSTSFGVLAVSVGSVQVAMGVVLAPIVAVAGAIYTAYQALQMFNAEAKAQKAQEGMIKDYDQATKILSKYRKETNNLKDTSKLSRLEAQELALAVKAVYGEMGKGSKQAKELSGVYDKLIGQQLKAPKAQLPTFKMPQMPKIQIPDVKDTKDKKTEKAKQVKAEEDYTNEVANLRKSLTDQIQKETQTELKYELWKIDQKTKAEKALVQKAILRKQATEADLTKIDYAAKLEKDRITKEFTDKEKKQADDLAKEIKKITQSELQNKIDAINEEFDAKKKLLEEGLKTNKSTSKDIVNLEKQRQDAIIEINNQAEKEKQKAILEAEEEKRKIILETQKLIEDSNKELQASNRGLFDTIISKVASYTGDLGQLAKTFFDLKNVISDAEEKFKTTSKSISENKNLTDENRKSLLANAQAVKDNSIAVEKYAGLIGLLGGYIEGLNRANWDNIKNVQDLLLVAGREMPVIGSLYEPLLRFFAKLGGVEFTEDIQKVKDFNKSLYDQKRELETSDYDLEIENLKKERIENHKKLTSILDDEKDANQSRQLIEDVYQKKLSEIKKKYAKPTEDKILDIRKGVIEKAFESEKKAIEKIYDIKKAQSEKYIDIYENEISRVKSGIKEVEDELKRREKTKTQSQETSRAFMAKGKEIAGSLNANFFRQPIDVFELQNEQAMQTLQMQFNTGMITLDAFNSELMNMSVKRNIFYQHVSDSLVKGTKEQIDFQKKANDAFDDFAQAQQTATEKQLNNQKKGFEAELDRYEKLKNQELNNIKYIEEAQIMAIENLTRQWQTPSGSFKLSMEEALTAVEGKMDLTLANFVKNAKAQIAELNQEKILATTPKQDLQNAMINKSIEGIAIPLPGGGLMYPFKKEQPKPAEEKPFNPLGFITDPLKKMTNALSGVFGGTPKASTDVQRQPIGPLMKSGEFYSNPTSTTQTKQPSSFVNKFSSIFDTPGFSSGGIFDAPATGAPAMLHNSEMILNPMQQSNLFRMINAGGGGGINVTINTGPVSNQSDINKIASAVSNVIRRDYIRA